MRLISVCIFVFLITITSIAKSQYSVIISPQGPTTFCEGDSLILIATTSGGSSISDQSDLTYTAGMSARNLPGYSHWQSFTAGVSGILSEIELGFFNYINGIGTLNVYEGKGIGGLLLNSQIVNVNCPSGNCMLTFAENIEIIAGSIYTFQFIPGVGLPDPYGVQVNFAGSYSGGLLAIVDPSGTDSINGMDMVFRTHVLPRMYYLWSDNSTDTSLVVYSNGTYSVSITDSLDCYSYDEVTIIVNSVDTSVSVNGITLTANNATATYQWIDCGNGNTPINNATFQDYTPLIAGSYAVVVTDNNCSDTSSCYTIFTIGVSENNSTKDFQIFPNPSIGSFQIYGNTNRVTSIEINNMIGDKIYSQSISNQSNTLNIELKKNISSGIYFVKIFDGANFQIEKIIIQ